MKALALLVQRLTLRQRFLVAPLLAVVLLGALTAGLIYESYRQSTLLKRVAEQDLAAYGRYADAFVDLWEQHMGLYEVLYDTKERDEEKLYLRTKKRLYAIHRAVQELEGSLPAQRGHDDRHDAELVVQQRELLAHIQAYRNAAAAAIEMTVDVSATSQQLAAANTRFIAMNRAFDKLLDSERADITTEIARRVRQGEASSAAVALAGALVTALVIALSFALAQFLSRSLRAQISALTELGAQAGAGFSVSGSDEVGSIAQAVGAFRSSLLQLRDKEQALAGSNQALTAAMDELRAARDELERRVQERTQQLEEANDGLKKLAFYDALTELPNRRLFSDRLSVAVANAQRLKRHVSVVFVDLDHFKVINDSFGHPFGDALLQQVATRLKLAVRESDTVGRLGADWFAIAVTNVKQSEDAGRVAEKVRALFGTPFHVEGRELHVTASIGVAVYPVDGADAVVLLKNAEVAMFAAKEQGRDRIQFYTAEMGAQAKERIRLEGALRRALENREFELHYQPKVDLASGAITGCEALMRWRSPELGVVPPARFIPIAEETGLIAPLGAWALATACAQAKAWHAAGHSDLSIAVNLSARQFRQHDIPELVRTTLAATELSAAHLELELTESLLIQDDEHVVQMLRALKSIGVTLSLDDFGTGYSSLSYLKRFPIDFVKIDRSFIRDVDRDPDDAALTRAIIAMAQSLDLETIAEGVETEAQLQFLGANGCNAMQGYYFSRPLPASEMTELLRSGKQLPEVLIRGRPSKQDQRDPAYAV